jgi:hypothetical protein
VPVVHVTVPGLNQTRESHCIRLAKGCSGC